MKIWKSILAFLGAIIALFAIGSSKSAEVKKLSKVIKDNKKKEKQLENDIKKLEESKQSSKKEIKKLKNELLDSKVNTGEMEKTFNTNNVDEAVEFLRKFAKK